MVVPNSHIIRVIQLPFVLFFKGFNLSHMVVTAMLLRATLSAALRSALSPRACLIHPLIPCDRSARNRGRFLTLLTWLGTRNTSKPPCLG